MNNMNDKNFDLVMPAAKKLILENDIDANIMQGTGKDGRITKGDVLLFLKSNGISQKLTDNKNQEENLNINENRKGSTMDIIVPTLGESIVEATVSKWLKNEGEYVEVASPKYLSILFLLNRKLIPFVNSSTMVDFFFINC